MSKIDLLNKRFERLTVIRMNEFWRGYWVCLCNCGQVKNVKGSHLRDGLIRSCGCLRDETSRERALAGVPRKNFTGHSKMPEYGVWASMKERCFNPNSRTFHHYGKRGITVCDRWRDSFKSFIEDMGPRPLGTWLERVNNEGNYEPQNCRWATKSEQMNNRRANVRVTYRGEIHTLTEWADLLGISSKTVSARYLAGMPVERIFSVTPLVNYAGLITGGQASGAKRRARTHCYKGHEFSEANTKMYRGARICRMCDNERSKALYARRKASGNPV